MYSITVPSRRRSGALLLVLGLVLAALGLVATPAVAAPAGPIDFVAAGPGTYDHQTAVGTSDFGYRDRTISRNAGVVESLEGGDYNCEDLVPFFTRLVLDADATTVTVSYSWDRYTTGNQSSQDPGVGYRDVVSVAPSAEPANTSSATVLGTPIEADSADGNELTLDVTVGPISAGDVFILQVNVQLGCDGPPDPDPKDSSGTLQARLTGVVADGQAVQSGEQTITLKSAADIIEPPEVTGSVSVEKTPSVRLT